MKSRQTAEGFILTAVLMLMLIASLIGGAFLFSARHSFKVLDQWRNYDEALLSAQAGLEQAKYELDQVFRASPDHTWNSLDILANLTANQAPSGNYIWTNKYCSQPYVVTVAVTIVSSANIRNTNGYMSEVILTNIATATRGGVTRRVQEIVRYVYAAPIASGGSVFDNIYYVDHQTSFNGVNGWFVGDVRAAGDIDFQNCSSLYLDGDVFAGGAVLNYASRYHTWTDSDYLNNTRARPLLWTDRNTNNASTYWPMGYSGKVRRFDGATIPEMPYIGPLSEYEDYAFASTGTLTRGISSTSKVHAVWGDDPGEDAGYGGTNDYGCLVLTNGTTISGVVVARGDVYIKGRIKGQGTIYAGRNIYVIGNLTYSNPPVWNHPDSTPSNTASINKTRDFVALCAKGNLILGNDFNAYLNTYAKLVRDGGITHTHASDTTDVSLGYVSYVSNGVPMFNGDYTAIDGQFHNSVRTDGTPRQYFEPMLSDAAFNALNVSARISWLDGVIYANHMIAGTTENNMRLNGSMVCRDEVIKRTGNLYLSWDIRLGSRAYDAIGFGPGLPHMLPRQGSIYRTIIWTEVAP
jgi:hypothetical protein